MQQRGEVDHNGRRERAHGAAVDYSYLLDEDDDLAAALPGGERDLARRLTTVRVLGVPPGEHDLVPWFALAGDGPGLLLLDGLVALETHLGDRTATELVGAGDLLMPPDPRADEIVEQRAVWRVLMAARVAILDGGFVHRSQRWPALGHTLMQRVSQRLCDIDGLRAIASHPRLELRLVLVLWHLASRWGRVEPSGIRLLLPLTHRLLGQLVAAERPSITHALTRLSDLGLISGTACDLHLHGDMASHIACLTQRSATRHTPPRTAVPAVHQAM